MTHVEARKLVADALRSGKYKQGRGTLCRWADSDDSGAMVAREPSEFKYCCLGVACEVYQEHVGDLTTSDTVNCYHKRFNGETGFLPSVVQNWLKMDRRGTFKLGEPAWSTLVSENDMAHADFNKIADLFETAEFIQETADHNVVA